MEELEKSLSDGYIKPRVEVIATKVREAVLGGEIDWYRAAQPKGKPERSPLIREKKMV